MKVLVVGATGQTGKHIVKDLTKRNIAVTAVVRNLEKAQELFPSGVDFILGDVTKPDTIAKAMSHCNILICATGATPSFDFTDPYQVDCQGTKNLVNLAQANNIEHFVIVSSLCVSRFFHPLNLFWLVLFWKKQAELYLQQSGLTYTIVRPGGLKSEDNTENIVMLPADTLFEGSIPRQKVAQVCVESLFNDEAKNKIVEIVTNSDQQSQSWQQLFAGV